MHFVQYCNCTPCNVKRAMSLNHKLKLSSISLPKCQLLIQTLVTTLHWLLIAYLLTKIFFYVKWPWIVTVMTPRLYILHTTTLVCCYYSNTIISVVFYQTFRETRYQFFLKDDVSFPDPQRVHSPQRDAAVLTSAI